MAALSLYYVLSLVLLSKPQTLFCTATVHGLHSRKLHVPLFPIPDDDQPQNPIFPLTPSTLNPPSPPPPSLQTYTIPTPKPKPPEHSHPSVPITDIVLISLLSFFILVCAAFGIYYCLYELRYYKSNDSKISSPESSNSSQRRLQNVFGGGDDHDHVSLPDIGNSKLQVISPELRPLPPLAHRDNNVIALAEKEEQEKLQFYSPATTLTNILTPPRNFGARTAEDSAAGSKRSPEFSSAPSSPS